MSFVYKKRAIKKSICLLLSFCVCCFALYLPAAAADGYTLKSGGLEIGFDKTSGKISTLKINGIDYFSYNSRQNGFIITDAKSGSSYSMTGAVSASSNKLTQSFTNTSAGIKLEVTYSIMGNGISVDGTVTDTKNTDRLITLEYLVPLKSAGMVWYDDIDNSRSISSGVYKYTNKPVNNQEMSVYAYSAVSDGNNTLSLGIPMESPLASVMAYEKSTNREALIARYNFGLSPKTTRIKSKANFSFVIYAPNEGNWGMRAAALEYYEMFPEYFEDNTREGGNWLFQHEYSTLLGVEDFGFIVNETPGFTTDEKYGVYSAPYTAPGEFFIDYTSSSSEPTYNELMAYFDSLFGSDELYTGYGYEGISKDYVARAIKNSALKQKNGNYYLWGYRAYGDSFAFTTNNSPNLPSPNIFDLQMNKLEVAVKQAEGSGASVDGIYIDNWTGGWDLDYNTANFGYTDYPLLWDSSKTLGVPLMSSMYEYGKRIREIADQKGWIVIGNSVFPETKGAVKYVNLVDIAGSEVWEGSDGGSSLESQRLKRMLVYQKTWANLLTNTAGVSSSLSFKEQLLKNSMVYGVFSNVMGYRVDSSAWEDCRHLFRKYTPIAKLTDKLGWQPITYAKYKYASSAVVERFGDFSNDSLVLTMANTGGGVLTSPVELDLTKFDINPINYNRIMGFDLLKNEIVPIGVNNGILSFERRLEAGDATAVLLGSAESVFEYIAGLAKSDLKRVYEATDLIVNEYNKYLEALPQEWLGYVDASAKLLQFKDNDSKQLFKNGVAIKNALSDILDEVYAFNGVAGGHRTAYRAMVLLPVERMYESFSGFFADLDKIPASFTDGGTETLENTNAFWQEGFDTATAIENAVISGSKIEFPWFDSMKYHTIVSGATAVSGEKSIRIASPGGLITSTYLNNHSTTFADNKTYIYTMLLKAENSLPDDFEYAVQGMTWQGSPNYFFTVKLGMKNGALVYKNTIINDNSFYPKSTPTAAVKDMGGGLYGIAVKFTGAKDSNGNETMFLRSDIEGSASTVLVDDYKLFSVSENAEPADFTPLSKPLFNEDFEKATTVSGNSIGGTAIFSDNDANKYYSVTSDSSQVINGGKSLFYRATKPTSLLNFGKNITKQGIGYRLNLSIKDLYGFADGNKISLSYNNGATTLFTAEFRFDSDLKRFVTVGGESFTSAVKENYLGEYLFTVDFIGENGYYFTLMFDGKIKCAIDDIVIRNHSEGESEERYTDRKWLTTFDTVQNGDYAVKPYNPVYQEDFIPIWGCDFEAAAGIAQASVVGTDVSFAWVGSEAQHSVCTNNDAVISGNKSLLVKHTGIANLNTANLTGAVKLYDNRCYVTAFNLKFITEMPDNFSFKIHAMTWEGSPNYFFTVELKNIGGQLTARIANTDNTIYPASYIEPACSIKRIGDSAYSIALRYKGAKASNGAESMFIRTELSGSAVEFSMDDFWLFGSRADIPLSNMNSKALLEFSNGFETATAVGSNNITGATMFKALRHPLKGTKMSANFSLGNKADALNENQSLIFENTESSRVENFAFGGNSESVIFKAGDYYVSSFDFKSVYAENDSSITLHYRSGGYSPVADDYLFSVKLKYSSLSKKWKVSEITNNDTYYNYDLPEVALQQVDGNYQFVLSFIGSKDRSGLEGCFISLEMNGSMKLLLDDFAVYHSGVKEVVARYAEKAEPVVSLAGDINFDGIVNALDLVMLRRHILEVAEINDILAFDSADLDGDGALNIIDLVKLKKLTVDF